MPLQNRVTPTGEIVAAAARGLFMGNRGRLHMHDRTLGARRWTTQVWIICRLHFRERQRAVMGPDGYTELFFLDEAVALAAGHRPCGECRRDAYREFREIWHSVTGGAGRSIQQLDRTLHRSRVDGRSRRQVRHRRELGGLPDGAFITLETSSGAVGAWLVRGERLHRYTADGYAGSIRRPAAGAVEVLTPAATIDVLASGYRPVLHPTVEG